MPLIISCILLQVKHLCDCSLRIKISRTNFDPMILNSALRDPKLTRFARLSIKLTGLLALASFWSGAYAGTSHVSGSIYGLDTVLVGDRSSSGHSSIVQGSIAAGKYLEVGYDGVVSDSIVTSGNILLRDRVHLNAPVTYAGSLTHGDQEVLADSIHQIHCLLG